MSFQGIKGFEREEENDHKCVIFTVVVAFIYTEDTTWHTLHCSLESTSLTRLIFAQQTISILFESDLPGVCKNSCIHAGRAGNKYFFYPFALKVSNEGTLWYKVKENHYLTTIVVESATASQCPAL